MKSSFVVVGAAILVAAGCQSTPAPAPVAARPTAATLPPSVRVVSAPPTPAPVVALVEPYLVPAAAPAIPPPPSSIHGNLAPLPSVPITPLPPIQGTPVTPPAAVVPTPKKPPVSTPPATVAPTPKRPQTVPPAIVKLFEDERAHSVDDARRRLAAATSHATQAAAEAKRQWSFVKSGFVAQKQAENADAAAKDALDEQSDAQKALDDAQLRQRNARRDIEAALKVASTPSPFTLAQLTTVPKAYQPVPGLYRLSVLGATPVTISVQNGTLGRRLPTDGGEAGAWLVRTPDPTRLRVGVGTRPATVVVRTLPEAEEKSKV